MTTRFVRRVTAVATALALVASLVAMAGVATPASAATPTISISPTSITDGGQVTIDLEGFDASQAYTAALVCPASYAAAAGDHSDAAANCSVLGYGNGSSLQTTVAVNDYNRTFNGGQTNFRCSALPGGCVIAGVNSPDASTTSNFVSTPITITPPPQTITPAVASANNGASVTLTTTGFPSGQPGTIGECPNTPTPTTVSSCLPLASYPNGIPASTQVVVHDQFQVNGTWLSCGCALAAWVDADPTTFAQIPFSVDGPVLVATPTTVTDGQTVTVSSSNGAATPGPASIIECPEDPNILTTHDYTTCSAPQGFTVDASGSFSIPFVFHDPIPSVDGTARPCGTTCGLVVITSNGPSPYFTLVGPPTPTIALLTAGPYNDGQSVSIELSNFPDGEATVAECTQVGTDVTSSNCTNPQTTTVTGGSSTLSYVVHVSFEGSLGGTVDCRTTACYLIGFGTDGVFGVSPLLRFTTPSLSLTPSTGLHDGDAIAVSAHGLSANTPYRLAHCVAGAGSVAGRCESPLPATVTSDANGNISTTVPASQRFTSAGFLSGKACFATTCSIAVIDSSGTVQLEQPYTLATPTVTASPATGLHDGDTVTVTGSNLEPDYAGPPLLFPTGGWAMFECDKAIGSSPSIGDLLTDCGLLLGGGDVHVPGTTSSNSVQVQATLNKILGGTTDCTASPGACVIGLTRWEQNATLTATFTPLTFG